MARRWDNVQLARLHHHQSVNKIGSRADRRMIVFTRSFPLGSSAYASAAGQNPEIILKGACGSEHEDLKSN